ncbi:MAG TPA: serine hydrolase domain-containing protein [Motilibacterales bacterium]|nr:serine hydrolase domain-containing protein [Motilibacterales bacterium]
MNSTSAAGRITAMIGKVDADPRSGEVLWRMRSDDGRVDLTHGDPTRQFFIASATKLYVTAILAQLRDEGRVDWDRPLATYVPDLDLTGLVVVGGRDRTQDMTVREVLAHTSGLADYFEGTRPDGPTTFARVVEEDFGWDVRDVLQWTRTMKPGTPGKGLYSDTGYQLLGAAIEAVDGRPFAESVRARISGPLGLIGTYCFSPLDVDHYGDVAALRYGPTRLRIPRAMASVQADGGMVSTLQDGLTFLGARLFARSTLDEMQRDWHRIFFPLEYGTGLMRLRMSPLMTGFRRVPPFVGHSGASGTVMFRAPELGLTVVGTVNQVKHRSMPYQLMVRATNAARGR